MEPTPVDAAQTTVIPAIPAGPAPTTPAGTGRTRRWVQVVALLAVMTSGVVACAMQMAPAPTARVERTSVSISVSASGALSAVQAQNIGFSQGGQLEELAVKVGDVVVPGQLLARLDDFALRQALAQAQAQVAQAQAQLDRILNGYTVEAAQRDLDAARRVLDATKAQADAANDAAAKATFRAAKELRFYEDQLAAAQQALTQCQMQNDETIPPPVGQTDEMACAEEAQAVGSAQQQVVLATTNLANLRKQQELTEENGRVSVESARRNVVMAENTLRAAQGTTPADIDAQRAAIANLAAAVRVAQQNVDNTVLTASIAGTIASINGAVGEFINSGSQTTPLAPGSSAAIPGVTSASADAGGSVASVTAPGGSNFIVLGDVNAFQVVVPFEESDAARVRPGQRVDVRFDALPDLTLPGTVLAVAPGGTAISGVTNYYATIQLTQTDPQLRDRQTAEANVLTEVADNVLSVPNAAVIREGGRTFVNVPGPDDGPVRVPFEAGLVGDDRTEVRSGLNEGQEVLLPAATVTATPETQQGGPR